MDNAQRDAIRARLDALKNVMLPTPINAGHEWEVFKSHAPDDIRALLEDQDAQADRIKELEGRCMMQDAQISELEDLLCEYEG